MSANKKSTVTKTLPVIKKNEKPSANTDSNNTKKTTLKSTITSNKLPEISPLKQNSKKVVVVVDVISSSDPLLDVPVTSTIIPIPVVENIVETTQLEMLSDPVNELATKITEITVSETAAAPLLPINGNGKVTLIYEQYNEQFDIVEGITTHENIDEVYCLSFVMPNCLIHLSIHSPDIKRTLEAEGTLEDLFVKEDPRGTYHTLEADSTYYVYVEQEADQLARDQERMRLIALSMEGGGARPSGDGIVRDDGRVMESCSCIYGNPCVDEYGCKDWSNRAAVALKNGWKGF